MKQKAPNLGCRAIIIAFLLVVFLGAHVALAYEGDEAVEVRKLVVPAAEKKIEQKREAVKEKIEERRGELTKRVTPDRQAIADRLIKRMEERHAHLLDMYRRHVRRWGMILDKIEKKQTRLQEAGVNTQPVSDAIAAAREEIAVASAVIEEQAGKTFKIDVSESDSLQEAAHHPFEELRVLHKTLREDVFAKVREAVHAAFEALRILPKPSPSHSPKPSPSPLP